MCDLIHHQASGGGGELRLMGPRGGAGHFCISMEPNLLGLLRSVRGLLRAYIGGLYFGTLALFNTITIAPFCPDLCALFICISHTLGLKSSQL